MVEDPLGSGLFILVLLVFSAFFSASETALTAIGKHKVKDYLDNENDEKKKNKIAKFLEKPNQFLTTILIMNNVVNILATSLSTMFIMSFLPEESSGSAIFIATAIMTILILIFGEITPKVYARENRENFFKFSFSIINAINVVLTPVVWVLVNLSNIVIKAFGGHKINAAPFITEDEIMSYLDISHEEGVIEKEEKYLMQRSLEMREISVKEIMTPRVDMVAIEDNQTVSDLIKVVNEDGYSRIPVYKDSLDVIVGIFYVKDMFRLMENNYPLGDFYSMSVMKMVHKPFFIPITIKVKDLLKLFLSNRTHLAIVVDEYGGTAGIVTLEDVIEELTGEILDEYDDVTEEADFTRVDENTIIANGSSTINDIEREFDLDLPDTEFETIGGFLLEKLERFPRPAEKIVFEGFEFEVISVTMNKVDKVKIRILQKEEENEGDAEY
ncbi:MAG: HlyC/CorC family transporter [Thermotogae bacterium]|nr:HlyC/CorC family transporter [Thermotogota bacterium]